MSLLQSVPAIINLWIQFSVSYLLFYIFILFLFEKMKISKIILSLFYLIYFPEGKVTHYDHNYDYVFLVKPITGHAVIVTAFLYFLDHFLDMRRGYRTG